MSLEPDITSIQVPARVGEDLQNSGGRWEGTESVREVSVPTETPEPLRATGSPAPRRSWKSSRWRKEP